MSLLYNLCWESNTWNVMPLALTKYLYMMYKVHISTFTIDQYRYLKIHTWHRGLGEWNKRNKIFISDHRGNCFCFIPLSLGARYEFWDIRTFRWVHTLEKVNKCHVSSLDVLKTFLLILLWNPSSSFKSKRIQFPHLVMHKALKADWWIADTFSCIYMWTSAIWNTCISNLLDPVGK